MACLCKERCQGCIVAVLSLSRGFSLQDFSRVSRTECAILLWCTHTLLHWPRCWSDITAPFIGVRKVLACAKRGANAAPWLCSASGEPSPLQTHSRVSSAQHAISGVGACRRHAMPEATDVRVQHRVLAWAKRGAKAAPWLCSASGEPSPLQNSSRVSSSSICSSSVFRKRPSRPPQASSCLATRATSSARPACSQ